MTTKIRASKPKLKNLMGKMRATDKPYAIFTGPGGWEWRVLKSWQADSRKPYARWFCAVKSPYTHGSFDMGDTYVEEVVRYGVLSYIDPLLLDEMGKQPIERDELFAQGGQG